MIWLWESAVWIALAAIAYVYAGYPAFLLVVSSLRSRPVKKGAVTPAVTVIIAAHNEEKAIFAKIENTLGLDYPQDRLEIIVASDGSSDRTNEIVESFGSRVRLLALGRVGKTAAQNEAAAVARGEILVFSDATTMYDRGALRALVSNYADPEVGCVEGNVVYVREGEAVAGQGRQLYWSYEGRIRRWESAIYSVIGATGCIYSLRKKLYTRLDPAAISDFVQPAKALLKGYRSVVEEGALAYEVVESSNLREELERRARVVLRGLRGVGFMREILNPVAHPWLFFELVSHRLLRWAMPVFLILLFVGSLNLTASPFYRQLFVGQAVLYLGALLALVCERLKVRAPGLFVPLYFCLINLAPLVALWSLLRGEKKIVWETGPQE